ncbi:MAG TPA: uracil-DNA glycosylase family protein, partial [Acidimicrobiales bacterium]
PPDNKPTTTERDTCRPYLAWDLEVLPWRVIVALGGFGFGVAASILGLRPRPRFGHGVEVALPGGRHLIASYHVSQQNTFTGKLTEPMLDAVFERARELSRAGR